MVQKKPCAHYRCPALIPPGEKYCERHKAVQPKQPCAGKRCPALVEYPEKYCPTCKAKRMRDYDAKRGTAASRGYGPRWEKFRKVYVASHPLCERCLEIGVIEPVAEVHHIKPVSEGGMFFDESNVMSVCIPCHRILEAEARRNSGKNP